MIDTKCKLLNAKCQLVFGAFLRNIYQISNYYFANNINSINISQLACRRGIPVL